MRRHSLTLSSVVVLAVAIALAVLAYGALAGGPAVTPPALVASATPSATVSSELVIPAAASPTATPTMEAAATAIGTRTPTLSPTPTQTIAPASIATATRASTPTLTPASTPTPSPIPVTEAEAKGVVVDFFTALDQDDYAKAVSKGSGQGRVQIQEMVAAIEGSARERGVQPDLEISNLTTDATTQSGAGRLVSSSFNAAAFAIAGPFRLPVSTANGSAVFLVERVAGEPKITEISSIEGLPGI
jgi:hypothetical protein